MAVRRKTITKKGIRPLPKEARPKSVSELKRKYNDLPLHFLFGVDEEIDHQCPLLDGYLKQLMEVKLCLEKIRKCSNINTARIHAAIGLHSLDSLSGGIDELTRGNFEKLRSTSEGWKQLAISALNDTKDPEKFLKI